MENLKEVTQIITINTSKEKTWDVLFNKFGEVNLFNPLIEGSHHSSGKRGEVGCERQCDLDSKTSVIEKITAARGTDSFDIEIIDGGLPMMKTMKATIDLKVLGDNKTQVSFTMKFNTNPAFVAVLMKFMVKKMLVKLVNGLKYYLETGNEVTKENISEILKNSKKLGAENSFKLAA